MAINAAEVEFWRTLRDKGVLPTNPRVLEVGEANWFGDAPLDAPEIALGGGSGDPFATARAFYRGILGPETTFTAIDLHGTENAHKLDLNESLPDGFGTFDLVINTGTLEHVFDQRRAFQTVHEVTEVGGLMVHDAPVNGWPDHGFYCPQPGLYRDIAKANDYEVVMGAFWQQTGSREGWGKALPPTDFGFLVALRKTRDAPFIVPRQGRYAG